MIYTRLMVKLVSVIKNHKVMINQVFECIVLDWQDYIKPQHIKPPSTDNDFNYLVDIYSKWHQNYFYFCAQYNCPSPNAISPSFEAKFARMEYVGDDKFNLSYMRHTGQWCEIYQKLPMLECLKLIAEEPYFIP
jgi:hypothetical protein